MSHSKRALPDLAADRCEPSGSDVLVEGGSEVSGSVERDAVAELDREPEAEVTVPLVPAASSRQDFLRASRVGEVNGDVTCSLPLSIPCGRWAPCHSGPRKPPRTLGSGACCTQSARLRSLGKDEWTEDAVALLGDDASTWG